MKILFISNLYPAYMGQKRSEMTHALHDFTREWVKLGHNVKVFTLWDIYPRVFNLFSDFARRKRIYTREEEFELDNVSITRTPARKIPHFPYSETESKRVAKQISRLLKKYPFMPDLIVVHGLYPAQIASRIKFELKVPMALGIHNTDRFRIEKGKFPRTISTVLKTADNLVFRSPAIQRSMQRVIPEIITEKKTFVALSGIDKSIILSEHEFINKIQKQTKTTTFITACKLIPLKNIHILIQAFGSLQNNSTELIIIGDGPERKRLEKLRMKSIMSDKIHFLGERSREQVFEDFRKADFFVMVSKPETLGLVYLEAMANGCIPIGTQGEGIDGLIQDGYNGFLCRPRMLDLTKKLRHVLALQEREKRTIMENSLDSIRNYTTAVTGVSYLSFLNTMLEEATECIREISD